MYETESLVGLKIPKLSRKQGRKKEKIKVLAELLRNIEDRKQNK